jgi:chaperonin cofactor prefoldin
MKTQEQVNRDLQKRVSNAEERIKELEAKERHLQFELERINNQLEYLARLVNY